MKRRDVLSDAPAMGADEGDEGDLGGSESIEVSVEVRCWSWWRKKEEEREG